MILCKTTNKGKKDRMIKCDGLPYTIKAGESQTLPKHIAERFVARFNSIDPNNKDKTVIEFTFRELTTDLPDLPDGTLELAIVECVDELSSKCDGRLVIFPKGKSEQPMHVVKMMITRFPGNVEIEGKKLPKIRVLKTKELRDGEKIVEITSKLRNEGKIAPVDEAEHTIREWCDILKQEIVDKKLKEKINAVPGTDGRCKYTETEFRSFWKMVVEKNVKPKKKTTKKDESATKPVVETPEKKETEGEEEKPEEKSEEKQE